MGEILVGTASWTDSSLIESGWYPDDATTPRDRLVYYTSRFPIVEVDATYYAPPAEGTARLWAERTPDGFRFNVKAFSLLTNHPTKPDRIYKDLRPEVDADKRASGKNVYLRDLPDKAVENAWERFLQALEPLRRPGKLGAVLLQFPPWFTINRRNKQYILECKRRCAPAQVCVEFRNHRWMDDDNRHETLDFLSSYAVPYVCVDMPQGYGTSIPPVLEATADLTVVRFHGRSDQWKSNDIQQRFGYRYSEKEMRRWRSGCPHWPPRSRPRT